MRRRAGAPVGACGWSMSLLSRFTPQWGVCRKGYGWSWFGQRGAATILEDEAITGRLSLVTYRRVPSPIAAPSGAATGNMAGARRTLLPAAIISSWVRGDAALFCAAIRK